MPERVPERVAALAMRRRELRVADLMVVQTLVQMEEQVVDRTMKQVEEQVVEAVSKRRVDLQPDLSQRPAWKRRWKPPW